MNRRKLLQAAALTLVVRPTLELRADPTFDPDGAFVRLVCHDANMADVDLDSPIPRHLLRREVVGAGRVLVFGPKRIKFCKVGVDGDLLIDRLEIHNLIDDLGTGYVPWTQARGQFPLWGSGGDITLCWDLDGEHFPLLIVE